MASAIAVPAYSAPALAWAEEVGEHAPVVWWVVFVGFAYTVALAYAAYCTATGGSADISLTWRGFKVACYR
ncbi:MAG TPA: hypothetical protein VNT58_10670 [Gaiellaceae bacterium]|nr:hypothetical protein [Gaiellaceae bacterium]